MNPSYIKYKNVQVHNNPALLTPKEIRNFHQSIEPDNSKKECWNWKYLKSLYNTWVYNSFTVYNSNDTEIGYAVLVEGSEFKHSCKPNTAYFTLPYTGVTFFRAIGPIRGEAVPTVSFIRDNLVRDDETRQLLLKKTFFFDCQCELCSSPVQYDYAKLSSLYQTYTSLRESYSYQLWPKLYETHLEILKMFREMYYEYDPRILEICWNTCGWAVKLSVLDSSVEKIIDESFRLIKIIYGESSLQFGAMGNMKKIYDALLLTSNPSGRN